MAEKQSAIEFLQQVVPIAPDPSSEGDETSRNKIGNLLQVAAALEPQHARSHNTFVGQDADQIRRLRRKLLSREYSRRYRMRIREKIDFLSTGKDGKEEIRAGQSPRDSESQSLDFDLETLSHMFLDKALTVPTEDNWEIFVRSVHKLSLSAEGRQCVVSLACAVSSD